MSSRRFRVAFTTAIVATGCHAGGESQAPTEIAKISPAGVSIDEANRHMGAQHFQTPPRCSSPTIRVVAHVHEPTKDLLGLATFRAIAAMKPVSALGRRHPAL